MAVTKDRRYTKAFVYNLLEGIKGKTLGEVDKSHQFHRTLDNDKITGIAGMVIEQSVFGYAKDSNQECDIEIDGVLTELKTTGVRVPESVSGKVKGLRGRDYNIYLGAKEPMSITAVTFEPKLQLDFLTSHFWEKSEHLLIVFYEYKSYAAVPASAYADFPIVDYCYNRFTETEQQQLRNDWEQVRDYLVGIYSQYTSDKERNDHLVGFTHVLRERLMLIDLAPGFVKRESGSYQKPRYRLKKTFVDSIVRGHFRGTRANTEIQLKESFSSFSQLDARCHHLTTLYRGMSFYQLKEELGIDTELSTKDFAAKCILAMFGAECSRLNQIADFNKVGIIAKTIIVTPTGGRTEDMKLQHIDFEEWGDRNADFEDSEIYSYFCEHSFLCPIFCEHDNTDCRKTTFEGFKRFAFDNDFIEREVRRTWEDSRRLIHRNELEWEYLYDQYGNPRKNKSGAYMGAPNFPKSSEYKVFFRGGADVSTDKSRTETVNGIRMLPQFFWLKGSYIADKLQKISFI